ncbi:cellobiohydrolase [Ascobolus immersus RN42]|uniref:Glucanase n=1 Tax=Ascobolus immersus RN42 TaxID=1160509 RepID=A0A3N4IIY0_ASCIM|nr:cellobiohydrolase [Ascobolus immersus RN42]
MQYLSVLALGLGAASLAAAAPSPSANDVNVFAGKNFYANKIYAKKVDTTIKNFLKKGDLLNAARARTVKRTGTFAWISKNADIADVPGLINDALLTQLITRKKQVVEIVVYNLPDRDCSAKASDGELKLADGGVKKYEEFIDKVAAQLTSKKAQQLDFAVILEPDSLGNLITNMGIEKCAGAAEAYKNGVAYAIKKLQAKNIALYIDATHGGWLGWNDNLRPSAELYAEVVKLAGPKAKVRGLATNVSNYGQFIAPVRENYTEWSNSWDEKNYANTLAPHLEAVGFPAHFIVDVGRSGKAGIRQEWGFWCNLRGAGFGPRPTADTQDPLVDALVWAKPGGESDGTSDPSSARFDEMCAGVNAHVPAPEAGEWFDEYISALIKNAEPPIKPSWI